MNDEVDKPVSLYDETKKHAHMELVGMKPGDVKVIYTDVDELEKDFGFRRLIEHRDGLRKFV